MFTAHLVCEGMPRIKLGCFAVKSHHDAHDRAKDKYEKIMKKMQTGQWKVETRDEETGTVEVWGTV